MAATCARAATSCVPCARRDAHAYRVRSTTIEEYKTEGDSAQSGCTADQKPPRVSRGRRSDLREFAGHALQYDHRS
eukprot:5815870-Prymnesium_polylepis.1